MSKEEYANEIKRLAYHYNKGKEDERNRILKLIDVEIKHFHDLALAEPSFVERSFMSSAEQGLIHLKKRLLLLLSNEEKLSKNKIK